MLKGVLVKVSLPVVFCFIDPLQVSLAAPDTCSDKESSMHGVVLLVQWQHVCMCYATMSVEGGELPGAASSNSFDA